MSRTRKPLSVNVWNLTITLLIISTLFENLKLVNIAGTYFKPTHIIFLLAILIGICDGHVLRKDLTLGLFFLVLPCLPLYRISDMTEWIKSYVIYVILVSFLVFSFRKMVREFKLKYKKYIRLFIAIVAFSQILGVIQFICMNYFGVFFLRNVFGNMQYQKNVFNKANGFYRAYSLYHEPSFFGLVTLSSVSVMFSIGKDIYKKKAYNYLLVLDILAVFVSLSATCLIFFLVLLIAKQFIGGGSTFSKVVSIVALAVVLLVIGLSTNLLSPVMRLFTEVNIENSSGYERITTQLMYIKKTLQYFPLFGRGIGQEGNVDSVGIIGLYSATNNALAGVFVHFGLSALCIVAPLIITSIRKIRKNSLWSLIVICITAIYASTGAYISVDTFNMVSILLFVGLSMNNPKDTLR